MNKHLVTLIFLLFASLVSVQTVAKSRIGVLVYDGVLTSDVTAPLEVFGIASKQSWFTDYEVITISPTKTPTITTEEGLTIQVDSWIGEQLQLDALITTSSYNMGPLLKNKQLINFIKQTNENAQWIASNCSGSYLLAEAGLLNGKQATTWAGGEKDLKKDYPAVNVQFDQNVVVDGKYITSNGSIVSYQAALVLLENMTSKNKADEVAEVLQYARLATTPY